MDYLVIGSNGFAQVGSSNFHEKNKIEMRVLLEYLQNNYPIPEEFWHMCEYRMKWFSHDFGRYSEIVLVYDDHILNQWDESEADIKITKKLKEAGKILDIQILDHLILLPEGYTSMADEGMINVTGVINYVFENRFYVGRNRLDDYILTVHHKHH